ncbi:HAMP domain-containing protein [bacterium]|nr:HAMP domain-containing protein [bacterium]
MTAGLLQVANGNFNVKVAENRKDELGQAGKILDTMTSWLLERKKMSRFVAPQVLDIVSSGDFKGATEGVKKDVVVLVSDIRNFTTLSENFPPREIFSALNKHLDAMTRVIQKQHGVIDRFIGDAIIAVFYPSEKDSPAFRAIQAAASMRKEHNEIISVRRRRGEFVYEIGVGIESGQVVAGVMGDSKARLDFTVLGEPLQKAAELESASKKTSGTKIIVSSKVRAETNRDFHFVAVPGVDGAWELESVQIDNLLKTHPLQVGREVEIGDSAIEGSPALIPTLGFAPEKGPLFSTMSLSYCFLGIMPFVMVFIALNFWQSCVERSAKKEAQNSAQKSLRHIEQTIDAKLQIGLLVRNVLSAIRRLVENPAKNDSALKRLVNSRLDVVRKILPNSYWYYLSPERSRTRVKQKKLKTEFVHVPTNSISNFLTASEVENFLNHFLITLNSAEIFLYDDPDLSNMGSSFQSFFKAFKNRFGEFGIHNFTKLILQSYGDLIPVAVNKLPKLLFWELLYPSASSSIEIKRKEGDELGGFFLLVDSMDLGISTGIRCLVENFQIGGTQIAFFPETGSQPWGYVSPMFKRSRVLKKILSKPFAETQFYEGWVACEKVIYADQKYRVLIAFPFQGSSAVISKLKSVFLLIVFLGLLFGGFLFLSDYKATFGKVSLGTQLACAFLSVLFPSLIVGIFTLEGSFSERVTRKYLDNQRNLNETLANVDESSQMYSGFISSLVKQVTSEQSFLKKVENAEKKFLENPRVFKDQNVMLELYQKWHALGFDLSHCKIVGGNGFSLETGIHKEKADLFRIVSERALLALNPGLEAQKATNLRRSNILKGAEVDEILSFSETLLPVDTFSAWLVAPRSYGYLVAPGSPEVHCLNQYLLKDGKPRWFLQVDWAQNSLRVHTLREWSNFFSDSKNIVFGASSYDFPSWSLIPPFYSYDFQDQESENYEEGNLIMEEKVGYQYPEIGIQIKMAQGSKEAFSGIVGKGDNSQLLYVFPGREMKKIALYCLSSISGSLESTFQSAGKQRSVFFILVSISIFLAFKVSHRFLNPVLDLISGARKIMQGNFSPRLFDEGEDEFSRLGKSFNKMAKGVAEGELLSRFVSDSVQATVRSSEKEFAAKEGEGMTVAVLFSDISRFKEMMRETAAVKIVESLNQYLEKMSFLIRSHGGDIDKFMGNKILAVFYPRKLGSIEEAVSSAMRSARAMQSAMDDLDAWKEKSIGIGIAVGPVLAGILGSPEVRLEYTVIGDTVNLASRLCEMASQKPNGGLVIEMNSVQRLMKIGNHQLIRGLQRLGDVSVKGKMRKVSAFILERKDT